MKANFIYASKNDDSISLCVDKEFAKYLSENLEYVASQYLKDGDVENAKNVLDIILDLRRCMKDLSKSHEVDIRLAE